LVLFFVDPQNMLILEYIIKSILNYQYLLMYFEEGREFRVGCGGVYKEGREEENFIVLER